YPNGTLYFAVGAAGGSRIITATIQNLWHVLDQNMTSPHALAQPRLHDQLIPNQVSFEWGYDNSTVAFMAARGHNVTWIGPGQSTAQALRRLPNGTFEAAGEPRQANSAMRSSVRDGWNGPGARQSLRMQLMGPGRELPRVSQDSGFGDSHDSGNHTRGHPSRQGSLNTMPYPNTSSIAVDGNTGGSRLSLVPETQSIDVEAAIAILQELRKKASPEDLVALHKALLPTKDVDHVVSPTAPEIEEFMDHNAAAVSRRRSMLVPGLATRGGPDNDVLRKPIPPMPLSSPETDSQRPHSEQPMWPNNIASVSPLTHLAALDLANDRRQLFEERASTPSDINYSHIGALRLGSLHITNGAASPEPSTILELTQSKPISDAQAEEGYYTASEGRSSDDNASQNEETFLT
ncbi:hypothetical protein B0A49_13397, partial [Cryomyces minteri]